MKKGKCFLYFIVFTFYWQSVWAQTCDDAPLLADLYRRSRIYAVNTVGSYEPLVDDNFLNDGWYTVVDQTTVYMMVSNDTGYPEVGYCGSNYVIYMIGDYPTEATVPDGTEINATACVRSYLSDCDFIYDIKIRNCNGRFQYYLVTTTRTSAYCFDPVSLLDVTAFAPAPTNASLGSLQVVPHLRHRVDVRIAGVVENYYPYLEFECSFNWENGFHYQVLWFYNDIFLSSHGPTTNITDLYLQEQTILDAGVTLGVNFKCGVSVSAELHGLQRPVHYSSDYFAGIQSNSLNIVVPKTSSGEQISFRLTVPIGCVYNKFGIINDCTHYIQMFERAFNCSGNKETLQTLTGHIQERCGTSIETLEENGAFNATKEYSVTVVTKDEDYADETHFTLDLRMEDRRTAGHPIWNNYQPESVSVVVTNTDANYHKYCYSHIDPHMKTPDGVTYEQQQLGMFLLYKNKEFDIEVHEMTESCNYNVATCTCAVAIRAGADVVMFNTCGRLRFVGYTACGDGGILRTRKISNANYEIHTPIGTYIRIDMLTQLPIYDGVMNVYIYMSPKDFGRTEGLCGFFDNNHANDLKAKDGTIYSGNSNYQFSESWRLSDEESLFRPNLQLTPWSDSNSLFCHCEQINPSSLTEQATCSASQFEGCNVTDAGDVTQTFCTLVAARRKRSLSNFYSEQQRRFQLAKQPKRIQRTKRSAVSITAEEAKTTCTEVISNSLVATNLTDMLGAGEVENKIEQCIYDVLDSNDLSYATVHVDTLNAIATFHIEVDPVYAANNTDLVTAFKQQSCPSNCSSKGTCVNDLRFKPEASLWNGPSCSVICCRGPYFSVPCQPSKVMTKVQSGTCYCIEYYHGGDCSIDVRDQLTIDDVTGGGICDTMTSDCTCFSVQTSNLIENFNFSIRTSNMDDHGNFTYLGATSGQGEYLSSFEGIVCATSNSPNFVTHHNLSISNDGTTFSSPVSIHVYDSTCQEYSLDANGINNFSVKSGFCHISGQCYQENDVLVNDGCRICNSTINKLGWTNTCTESEESLSSASNNTPSIIAFAGRVIGGFVGLVLVAIGTLFCVKKCKKAKSTASCDETDNRYDRPRPIGGDNDETYSVAACKNKKWPSSSSSSSGGIGYNGTRVYDEPNYEIFAVEELNSTPGSAMSRPNTARSARSQRDIEMSLEDME